MSVSTLPFPSPLTPSLSPGKRVRAASPHVSPAETGIDARGRRQGAHRTSLSHREREASGREWVRGRRFAALRCRCFLAAALALVPLAAGAADVLALKPFGLGLGDDRSTVAEAFPNMVFESVDYADPVVDYTYEAASGRSAVDHLEGRGFRPVPGRSPTEFVVRLTGDERLYELSAWESFDAPINCAKNP